MEYLNTLKDTIAMSAELFALSRPGPRRHAGRGGRHLALFSWALPPSSGAGVYRPLSFMRYGCRLGWRIDAFCGEPQQKESQHGDELLALVPPETTLHVSPPSTRMPSHRFFPRVDGGFSNGLALARAAVTALHRDPPDVVLGSGPPFHTFVSALLVARRFGVPLVLDYRDEWTECPYDFVISDGSDKSWERRCLETADAVLFTTESHRLHQLAVFPELDARKTHLVPNGWEPENFVQGTRTQRSIASDETPTLRLAHVGNLSGHTPVHDFLESLTQLLTARPEWKSRLTVELIGRRSKTSEKLLRAFAFPEVLRIVDHVGKREANRLMQEADVLLLLANKDLERYLPGKLFDYMAARRPILVFGAPGEASDVVERLGSGMLCAPCSGESLGAALEHLQRLDVSLDQSAVREWLDEHRRDALASRAFGILDSLVSPA